MPQVLLHDCYVWLPYNLVAFRTIPTHIRPTTTALMALGSLAWLVAGMRLYNATSGHHGGGPGTAVLYLVGGTLAFFINDVASLVGNTIKMDVSLSNVCTMMGGS